MSGAGSRDLQQNVYRLAAEALAANWPLMLAIALLQAALQAAELAGAAGRYGGALTLLRGWLQIPILYLASWTILNGGAVGLGDLPWPRFWGFFWRLLLIGLPAAAVMMTVQSPGLFTLLVVAVAGAVLALFGTVLPDVLAGGAGRFDDAFRRGLRTIKPFIIWMFAGPVAATAGLMLVVALIGGATAAVAIWAGVTLTDGAGLVPWFAACLAILGSLTSAVTATMVAAVLSRAWAAGGGVVTPAAETRASSPT